MSITSDNIDNIAVLSYLKKIDKKISNLEYDLNDLKTKVCKDTPPLSTCTTKSPFSIDVDQSQLDIEERNFDKAWILKHYRVDCPEFDQPLSMQSLRNLGYDMTPEEYGKYIASFDIENDQKVEAL